MSTSTVNGSTTGTDKLTIAVVGAGGKMGMRVSRNLQKTSNDVRYVENNPESAARMAAEGRTSVDLETAVAGAHVVVLAVPDVVLDKVTTQVVPQLDAGSTQPTMLRLQWPRPAPRAEQA